jgi:hypothetical protein
MTISTTLRISRTGSHVDACCCCNLLIVTKVTNDASPHPLTPHSTQQTRCPALAPPTLGFHPLHKTADPAARMADHTCHLMNGCRISTSRQCKARDRTCATFNACKQTTSMSLWRARLHPATTNACVRNELSDVLGASWLSRPNTCCTSAVCGVCSTCPAQPTETYTHQPNTNTATWSSQCVTAPTSCCKKLLQHQHHE